MLFAPYAMLVSLVLACQATARSDAAPPPDGAPADSQKDAPLPLTPPGVLPAPDDPPSLPTTAPPAGTPTDPGTITQILAVDRERAVVVFTPYGVAGAPSPVLASMGADGSIAWSVAIDGEPLVGRTSTGIELVGDAVSIAIAGRNHLHPVLDRIEIYGVPDGKLRSTIRATVESYARDTIVDRGLRIDTVLGTSEGAEIIASDARGELWRAHHPSFIGAEIIALPQHIAVPTRSDDDRDLWQVFDRARGKRAAMVEGDDACSDGERWFVRGYNSLFAVDLTDFSSDLVLDAERLPTSDLDPFTRGGHHGDTWAMRDCTIIDGKPVAFAQLGMIEGLVSNEPAGPRFASLGVRRMRDDDIDPLPDRLHPFVALRGLDGADTYDLLATDFAKADREATAALQSWVGVRDVLQFDGDKPGYVVATREVIGIVDGKTGAMTGHHIRRDTMAMHRTQLVGHHLWLPPAPGMQLGRAAPIVLDLAASPANAAVRGALATALGRQRSGAPAMTCGSTELVRYDGIETAAGLGPVTPSREPPWDAENLAVSARRFACASPTAIATLVAWSIVEDSRPLRNHGALVVVEDTIDGAPVYTAVAMYRHATNIDWNIAVSFHNPSSPLRRFLRRPTSAELDAFALQADFTFVDTWGQVKAGNVLDSRWVLVTGEPPLRHFAPTVEQSD